MNLNINHYIEKYFSQYKIDYHDYLENKSYDKNIEFFNKKIKDDLKKCELGYEEYDIFVKYLFNSFKKENEVFKKQIMNNEIIDDKFINKIDIDSPMFQLILKDELFSGLFTIPISNSIIETDNKKKDYINCFNVINKSNIKYPYLLFGIDRYIDKKFHIKLLQELNIDFSKITKLNIVYFSNKYNFLFPLFNVNNLVYLNLNSYENNIDSNSFEIINSLKSLKKLYLKFFNFIGTFTLKLFNLKYLNLFNCKNIFFAVNQIFNLEELYIYDCRLIINQEKSIIFPKLKIFHTNEECPFIDFEKLTKLKEIKTQDISLFIKLGGNELENIYLEYYRINSKIENIETLESEKILLKKILSAKNLKSLKLSDLELDDKEILDIKGENTSLQKASFNLVCPYFQIENLLNKFPNITDLDITISYPLDRNICFSKLLGSICVEQNKKSKINKIKISMYYAEHIKLYCMPFENLISINIMINHEFKVCPIEFPIFNDCCDVIFKNLTEFQFEMNFSSNILNNIYNNINKMPNLKKFYIKGRFKDNITKGFGFDNLYDYKNPHSKKINAEERSSDNNITEEFYKQFIRKILSLKLDSIYIDLDFEQNINEEYYTEKKLKEIYPKLKFFNLEKIKIKSYKNEEEEKERCCIQDLGDVDLLF